MKLSVHTSSIEFRSLRTGARLDHTSKDATHASSVDIQTAVLIGVGGVLIHQAPSPLADAAFHNAIWHSFVLIAASCHTQLFCTGWYWRDEPPLALRSKNAALLTTLIRAASDFKRNLFFR
jgi:hypothetical protein